MPGAVALVLSDEMDVPAMRRLCAVSGYDAEVVSDLRSVRRVWSSATAVVVDSRFASAVCDAGLGRRPRLVVVSPGPPDPSTWARAVAIGAEAVISLATDEQKLLEWLSRIDDSGLGSIVLGCVGAVGGAGSSTLAVALAQAAAVTGPVTLVDADASSGGLDLLMGVEKVEGRRWPDLVASSGVIAASALRSAVPMSGHVAVVSCGPDSRTELSAEAMASVLDASRRGSKTVIVDLPRRFCAAAEVAAAACNVIFVVVPLQVRAVVAATGLTATARDLGADIRVVVRTPGPADLTVDHVARKLGVGAAGTCRTERRIAAMAERGELHRLLRRTGLAATASRLLESTVGPR